MINHSILNNIKSVLHLGACNGEEARFYRNLDKVVFVEANPELIRSVEINSLRFLKNYKIYNNIIFNKSGLDQKFNIIYSDDQTNKGCSSIFELKEHSKYYPHIKKTKEIVGKTITIDDIVDECGYFDLLNMDLQGAELVALQGSIKSISTFHYIYTEVSYVELYENNVLFNDLVNFLKENNFQLLEEYKQNDLWGDALFINLERKC